MLYWGPSGAAGWGWFEGSRRPGVLEVFRLGFNVGALMIRVGFLGGSLLYLEYSISNQGPCIRGFGRFL